MKKILFLCTGNACRSQMAEGFARGFFPDVLIYSAGIEAHGLNPIAIQVMSELGIEISQQTSDILDLELLKEINIVITVCGHADELCPVVVSTCEKIHWSLSDPAKIIGSEQEVLTGFRKIRDEIRSKVRSLEKLIN